ncbi:MAG TPA: hypothetical protein VMW52_07845 [Phycisphaerae bacterium]|nr:hypothetical protein [Phycisphaerae bacterium]
MLSWILTGIGVALKIAAPIFVPSLMSAMEKKMPASGDGPKRRDAVLRAVRALAVSLENDGVLSVEEREDLYRHIAGTIETFVPAINATAKGSETAGGQAVVIRGYIEAA